MKKIYIILVALVLIISSSYTVSVLWNIASAGVTVSFELPEEGTKGTLSGLKASIDFDPKALSASSITASVAIATLNTGKPAKDKHLLSSDFFDAAKFPTASFTSSSIKATKEGFLATGSLTLKDSTKVIEIPFTFMEDANGAGVFNGTMSIHTRDYGIKSKGKKDKVVVTLHVPVKK